MKSTHSTTRLLPLALLCAALGTLLPATAANTAPPNYKVCPVGRACKWVPMPAAAVGRVTSIIPDNAIPGVTSSWIGKSMTARGERHHRCYNAVNWRSQSESVCTMIHYTRGLAGYTTEVTKAADGSLLYVFKRPHSLAGPNPHEMRYVGQYMYGLIAATRQLHLLAKTRVNFSKTAELALKTSADRHTGFTTEGNDDGDPNNGGVGTTPGNNGWGTFGWDDFGNSYGSVDGASNWDGYESGAYEVPVEPIASADWDSGYPNMPDETTPIDRDFPDFVSDDVLTRMAGKGPGEQTGYFCVPFPIPVCIVTGTAVKAPFPTKVAIDKMVDVINAFRRDTGAWNDDDGDSEGRDAKRAACFAAYKVAKKLCDDTVFVTDEHSSDFAKLQVCYTGAIEKFETCMGLNQ